MTIQSCERLWCWISSPGSSELAMIVFWFFSRDPNQWTAGNKHPSKFASQKHSRTARNCSWQKFRQVGNNYEYANVGFLAVSSCEFYLDVTYYFTSLIFLFNKKKKKNLPESENALWINKSPQHYKSHSNHSLKNSEFHVIFVMIIFR